MGSGYVFKIEECFNVTFDPNYFIKFFNGDLKSKHMNPIIKFVKDLTLTQEEKNLRQAGFKDENGNWTNLAWEVTQTKMIDDNLANLIDLASKYIADNNSK